MTRLDELTIRSLGVIDDAVLGTLEYAVDVLDIPLVVVLGHERCGAEDEGGHDLGRDDLGPRLWLAVTCEISDGVLDGLQGYRQPDVDAGFFGDFAHCRGGKVLARREFSLGQGEIVISGTMNDEHLAGSVVTVAQHDGASCLDRALVSSQLGFTASYRECVG